MPRQGTSSWFNEEDILRALYQYNPWWLGKSIPESRLKPFRRQDYYKIFGKLDDDKILALIGPRQVGKTTLVYQLIENLLLKQRPQDILFVLLDDPSLGISSAQDVTRILELYAKSILKKPLEDLGKRVYIFLDEIQSIENWERVLKRWYDLSYKIKFTITGSSSTGIMEGASEALVGRLYPQIMVPMRFPEYLQFKEKIISERVKSSNERMRNALKAALTEGKKEELAKIISEESEGLLPYKDRILVHLNQYLISGGYPEIAKIESTPDVVPYLRNYLHLTIYKDIIRTGRVRDPIALENLVAILAKNSSQIVNRESLGKSLGLKRDTLNAYIHLLKTTFLISEVEFYSESRVKRIRREKKIFINDIGLRNVLASALDEQTLANETEMGRVVETVVADHLHGLRSSLEYSPFPFLYYWRERHEVDFVLEPLGKLLAVEVKYRENIEKSDLEGIMGFARRFMPALRLVVTKNKLGMEGRIFFVPLWLFLLMC
ncbi:MAG: ATP-binding protein [Thaumarchaeota archaeon]|nr:ATP-binding protein [Nitrososphaerota archaeon]